MIDFGAFLMLSSFLLSLLALTVIYILYIFGYCFFVKPYLRVRYFLQRGGVGSFTYGPKFFIDMINNSKKYGNSFIPYVEAIKKDPSIKFFVASIGPQPLVILTDMGLVKEFLRQQDGLDKFWNMKELQQCFEGALVFLHDEKWKQTRKLISPQFQFNQLKREIPMIAFSIKETFKNIIKSGNLEQDAIGMFAEVAGEVIIRYLFNSSLYSFRTEEGLTIPNAIHEFAKSFFTANNTMTRILFGAKFVEAGILPLDRKYLKDRKDCYDLCRRILEDGKKNNLEDHSYLKKLLEVSKEKDNDYDDERIIGEMFGLLIAGGTTLASTVGYSIYHLFKHQNVLKKLLEEIDREVPDLEKIDLESLNRLDYLNSIIKEVLRLTSVLPAVFFRDVLKPRTYGNITVKKGDLVSVFFPIFQLSEKYFSQPLEFLPERWMPDGLFPDDGWKHEPYAYLPFSSGPRNCVGQHLAMIEAKIILMTFMKRFRFSFPKGYEMKTFMSMLSEPLEPLRVTLDLIRK